MLALVSFEQLCRAIARPLLIAHRTTIRPCAITPLPLLAHEAQFPRTKNPKEPCRFFADVPIHIAGLTGTWVGTPARSN